MRSLIRPPVSLTPTRSTALRPVTNPAPCLIRTARSPSQRSSTSTRRREAPTKACSVHPWPDEQTPGVPGPDLSQDYYVLLASTILDLKAGLYRMGVNSDDGFVVTSDDPRDVFTAQSGTAGGRGPAIGRAHG